MQKNHGPLTKDSTIRSALRNILSGDLENCRQSGHQAEVFEELGICHGTTRIDFAIINGLMHGYEIKSDRDTLKRLPEQVKEFSNVFDRMTLVVGKHHLYHAIHVIPDWWGVIVAKINANNKIIFQTIRESEDNKEQAEISIARLLWREEALRILEEQNEAIGMRTKPREILYKKLTEILDIQTLKETVSSLLIAREGWRSDPQLLSNGG